MSRILVFLFGVLTYGLFFATFLYLIAFVGSLQLTPLAEVWPWLTAVVPYSVDAGREPGSPWMAVVVNAGLILLFGLQHSIMARSGFKAWIHRKLPPAAERSVFVLLASLVLILLMWQWRPMPGIVWHAESVVGQGVAWTGFALGFTLVLVSTFLIDHFDLFGLKQVWCHLRGSQPREPRFTTPLLYELVRHPLYLGFFLAFWSAPVMTFGRLLFAGGMSVYVLIAVRLEEKDLLRVHGDAYASYRRRVPMLVPLPGRRRATGPSNPHAAASVTPSEKR